MTVPWLTFIRGRSPWMHSMVIDQDAAFRLNGNHGSELKSGLPICIPSKVHIERQGSSYVCDPWISSTNKSSELRRLIHHLRLRRIGRDGLDPVLHRSRRRVHLTLADRLAIAGGEDEVRAAVLGGFADVARVVLRVRAHGLDSVLGSALRFVRFAAQDYLVVAGFEVEAEFAGGAFFDDECSGHGKVLLMSVEYTSPA